MQAPNSDIAYSELWGGGGGGEGGDCLVCVYVCLDCQSYPQMSVYPINQHCLSSRLCSRLSDHLWFFTNLPTVHLAACLSFHKSSPVCT